MRPQLKPAQAAQFTQDRVLRYTGPAGADRDDPWQPAALIPAAILPHYLVTKDGPLTSVQSAIDLAIRDLDAGQMRSRVMIGVAPGVHDGLVYVPKVIVKGQAVPFTICGMGRHPGDTTITATIDAEMPVQDYARRFALHFAGRDDRIAAIFRRIAGGLGIITTANASVLRVESDDFQLLNLTVANAYNADRPQTGSRERNADGQFTTGQHQAVAVLVAGADRVQIQNVHLRSFQDTLYLQAPRKGETVRAMVTDSVIEGDVDFIFGQTTAWFSGCVIRSLGSRAPQSWVTAPSTDIRTRYGFVFYDCDFVHDGSEAALKGQLSLGRQWFESVRATPYGTATVPDYRCDLGRHSAYHPPAGTISPETLQSVGKCVIRESRIGAHIHARAPWADWNGGAWTPRFRPVQYSAGDMKSLLATWLPQQGISFDDIPDDMIFLGEFGNTTV